MSISCQAHNPTTFSHPAESHFWLARTVTSTVGETRPARRLIRIYGLALGADTALRSA